MDTFGRIKINGKTYKKTFYMDAKTVYKLVIDGLTYYEEHETVEQAMKMARVYFSKDHTLKEAEIVKYTREPVGMVMFNKDYEEVAR